MSTKLSASSMKSKATLQPSSASALRRSTTRALALGRMNAAAAVNGRQRVGDHEGFENLRNYIKRGAEFSKELVAALNERADLETNYSKGLAKVSAKVFRAAKESNGGTVSNAWHFVAEDMEATADTHKSIASLLVEEIVKPLKMFAEAQHRTRKSVESLLEKRAKALSEWRAAEAKNKSKCYANAKDNERVQDAVLDCKLGRGRVLSEKELVKLEGKRKKSEEAVSKSDLDYYASCLKAERARLEWESAVLRGCTVFRQMEEERLEQLRGLGERYNLAMGEHRPKLVASSQRLEEPIANCNVRQDMEDVSKKVDMDFDSTGDQILPSFYAEDTTNAMNAERRRDSLAKCLRVVKSDIDREKKGMAGVENLAKALQETPKFGGEDSQNDVKEKLQHMRSMLTYLEACRFRVLTSLLDMEGRPRISHPLSSYIEVAKDKSGAAKTVLRIPYWARQEAPQPCTIVDEALREAGNGAGSVSTSLSSGTSGSSSQHSSPGSSVVMNSIGAASSRRGSSGGVGGGSAAAAVSSVIPPMSPGGASAAAILSHSEDFAAAVLDEANDDGGSSEFDDFSDGDEEVNIIKVVNGIPSPVPPPPPATLPPTEEEEEEAAEAAADEPVSRVESSSSPVPLAIPTSDSSCQTEKKFVPKNSPKGTTSVSNRPSIAAAAAPTDSCSQENEVSEIYFLDEKHHMSPSVGQCRVIYDYDANMYDELTIRVGDVINIHDKQADGWWLGELGGTVGIFPATYVEEEEDDEDRGGQR